MNNIKEIWSLIEDDQQRLTQTITDKVKSSVDLSDQVTNYIIQSGGKRIRPLVLLLLARAMDYKGNLHLKLAAAVEFIHTATLLHDDVVDDSSMRRSKQTANSKFGNSAAVLVGDFLYSRAFQMIAYDLNAAQIMADATNELAMGEVIQLMNINKIDLTEEDYYRVIHLKTAVLFGAACQFSGVIAKTNSHAENLKDYGENLGRAFQIADDVLDYIGDLEKTGKNIGDDLAEGKLTLPLIHCIQNTDEADSERLKKIILNCNQDAIDEVIELLNKTDSITYAKAQAYQLADKAKQAIQFLPESIYKQALLALPDLAVQRSN